MLSDDAQALYRSLIEKRICPVTKDLPETAIHDLVELGLAQVQDGRVVGVCPEQGQSNLGTVLHEHTRELLDHLSGVSDFLARCAHERTAGYGRALEGCAARIVVEPAEVVSLSAWLPSQARHSYCSVQTVETMRNKSTHLMTGPAAQVPTESNIRMRVVVERSLVHHQYFGTAIRAGISGGEVVRTHPSPPLKFMMADQSVALVPLDESGAAGAMMLHSEAVCGMLAWTFEHLWDEAAPFPASTRGSMDLDPVHVRILRLLAQDESDADIAGALGVSDRSLRRHISALMDRLVVSTRAGAVAEAFRLGLLP